MTPQELYGRIDSLTEDIEFQYLGVWGAICPFSRTCISVSYGAEERTFSSVEAAMDTPFIRGKSLREIAPELEC